MCLSASCAELLVNALQQHLKELLLTPLWLWSGPTWAHFCEEPLPVDI